MTTLTQTQKSLTLAQQSAIHLIGANGSIAWIGNIPGRNGGKATRIDARTLLKLIAHGYVEGRHGSLSLTPRGFAIFKGKGDPGEAINEIARFPSRIPAP